MGQKFRMKAPNGQESVVDADERIGQERAIDVFRKNGAVVLGPADESEGEEPERPPAPTPIYNALTAQNVTGTGAEGMVRAATGRFGDFNADFGRGLVASGANMINSAGDLARYGANALLPEAYEIAPRASDNLMERAAQAPNSWGGSLGRLGGDVASYALGEGALKALPAVAKYGRAGQLGAEMAAGAGITGLQTGGDPAAMVAGAAFPVIGAARSAMGPSGRGRAGKLAADAALGYGAGYTLSGGDTDYALAGGLGLPALTGGYATTKALARSAGRIAAGAEEGGLGGAVAAAVRKVTPQDPWRMMVQALKPRNSQVGFEKTLPNIAPIIKHVAETAGMPLTTTDEILAATHYAKQTVRSQFDDIVGDRSRIVDLTPAANLQRTAIPSILEREHPAAYAQHVELAETYRGAKVPLETAEDYLRQTNAALEAYYQKFPAAQRKALASKPRVAMMEAKAKALRNILYGDNPNLPQPARVLNRLYGQLAEFEDTALRRSNVANRQQPESLSEQIGNVRAVGQAAKGLYHLAHGNPMGLADLAGAKAGSAAAKYIKEQQTTDALLRRAFEMVPGPGPRAPVRGLVGPGAIRQGPVPDTSGPIPGNGPGEYPEGVMRPGQRALPPKTQIELGGEVPGDPSGPIPGRPPAEYAQPEMRPGQRALPPGQPPPEAIPLNASPMDDYIKPRPADAYNPGTTLLGVAGPAAARAIPEDPESQLDDYARAALNIGGAAALGMAVSRKGWQPIIEKAFPLRDSFGKLKGFIKPDKIPEMMRAAEGATPEMITAAEKLAAKQKGKPIRAKAIIDALMGKKHDPGRILYDMKTVPKGTKPLPGAPIWVDSPEKEAESLRGYLQLVLDGVKGRNFYRESGAAILEHAGDNPDRAYRVSGAASITSPSTDVAGNTGHAVKGHNQAISGMPVKTGLFSNVMGKTVKKLYDRVGGALGPKREPFVRQIAMGGDFATEAQRTNRAVHDFWEGEAFRYVNPDGTPKRAGFGPAQHAWMDKMTDAAIAEANATKLGGFDDWDAGTLQAASWTGAKLRAGDIEPGEAAQSFANYLKRYYMQTGREFVPGSSTGHLAGLAENPQALDAYVKKVSDLLYDAKGREKSAMAKDMLVGGSHEGPGVWLGETSPGRQVNQMAGIQTSDVPKGQSRRVDDASMGLIEANESQYAMNMGQAAAAGTMLDYGATAGVRDAYDMKLPTGVLKMDDPILQNPALKAAVAAGRVVPIATPEGVRILNLGMLNRDPGTRRAAMLNAAEAPRSRVTAAPRDVPLTEAQARREAAVNAGEGGTRMSELRAGVSGDKFNKFRLAQAEALGSGGKAGKLETAPGKNIGFYIENNWSVPEGAAGQAYARKILAIPKGEEMFNATAPAEAKALNDIDYYLRDNFGIPLSETIHRLRNAIIENGMDGVRALAKQYGAPLAVLMALASKLGMARPPQEQGAH